MRSSRLCACFGLVFLAMGLSSVAVVRAADVLVTAGEAPPSGGALEGLARLELAGSDHVGGLSAALLLDDDRLMLASDRGWLLEARMRFGAGGRLVDLVDWRRSRPPLPAGWSRDLEGLAASEGNLLLSVEEPPHVIRFEGAVDAPERVASYLTWDSFGFEANRGFEALVDLPDGGWLAIAETAWAEGHTAVTRDGRRFRYQAADGFAPTGADRVGARIFVLERRVSMLGGWQARVACLDLAALGRAGLLAPVELARLDANAGIDNMEGIVALARGDDVDLLLVSDDNQSPFQQSLVLHYRWTPPASGGCGPSAHEPAEG